ncbi:MAG: F0F1 ATP synthase subunit delta [Patescibacteria group bacterium]|jgi:F0F1-type ATP synthase delta subunit
MAGFTNRQLADLLVKECAGLPRSELVKTMKSFVEELAHRGWICRWREIEHEIHGAWKRKFGAANVTIVSAHALAPSLRKSIEEATPGADIVERVDERLMGGAVIRIDDRRIDASVAGTLQRLKQCLEKSL